MVDTYQTIPEISVKELKKKLDSGEPFTLLDVRNEEERDFCNIGGVFIPLYKLQERYKEITKDQELIIYCRSGRRSLDAASFFLNQGYKNVKNLTGGILAWSDEVDPSVPKY